MKKIALALGMLAMSLALVADVETINGTTWFFQATGEGVEITYGVEAAVSPKPTGVLSIPSILGGRAVVSIGPYAFYDCSGLNRVMIPSSVKRIGEYAFYGCRGLHDLILPGFLSEIGNYAFYGCRGLEDVTVPGSVGTIGEYAFADCLSLERVVLQAGLKTIGGAAFYGNHALGEVTVPGSVELIGPQAFYDCEGLKRAVLQPGVANIGEGAFYGCTSLSEAVIPGSVASIGAAAFGGCAGLTALNIGSGVREVGVGAFAGCYRLKTLAIPSSMVTIWGTAFSGCKGLKSVSIDPGIQTIGDGAFYECGLTSVRVPASVTAIGIEAFAACSSLGVAVVPKALEEMVVINQVFSGTPASVIYVGETEAAPGGGGGSGGVLPEPSGSGGSAKPVALFEKAQSVFGALYGADGSLAGVVQLKAGKANSKGVTRVSGTATLMDGKKASAKSVSMTVSASGTASGTLSFRAPIGDVALTLSKDGSFSFANGAYSAKKATVGGALSTDSLTFDVAMGTLPDFGEGWQVISAAFPNAVKIAVADGKKWTLQAVSTLRYKKNRETGKYELEGLGDAKKPNVSGLRLSYSASTGRFKGNFKLYATNASVTPEGKPPKLKKVTVNVSGFMVDGVGTGEAASKSPALGPWAVSVK